eukprot:CAMPEP_0203988382 /NCGR_PEP_ID=MMETSP0360-20130528/7352_1 /ASSEMBLY_ACC=CAM_ASM_000342 /TAXON_ID=268821 /ORGANISM="Scrippsiella Hangoei, Strain SHTV-5" /LENGTH=46 /DNA_ID= /DNA_START= /DNA_END= /DNA_ORIENTATION=
MPPTTTKQGHGPRKAVSGGGTACHLAIEGRQTKLPAGLPVEADGAA